MRGTIERPETRDEFERDTMRQVTRRTVRGGGKLISGSIMAGLAVLSRTQAGFPNVIDGTPTAVLTWVVFGIGIILVIWGILERVEA